MDRRTFLSLGSAAALGLGLEALPSLGNAAKPRSPRRARKRVLFFTKSSSFEHSAIKRNGDKLSFAEQTVTDLAKPHDIEVTCSKDGGIFTESGLAPFDAFMFYTTGDLTTSGTDGHPPMSAEGKALFLEQIKAGKGFIGTHSASDTFHTTPDDRYVNHGIKVDPYIDMLGAEFIRHDTQQAATLKVVDHVFPGMADAGDSFELTEEWYSLKDFRRNLHVLLVQDTNTMKGPDYQRPPYPSTWARMHGKGRVFYTNMGHREDVWSNPLFQHILMGGITWTLRLANADVRPNIEQVTPGAWTNPPAQK